MKPRDGRDSLSRVRPAARTDAVAVEGRSRRSRGRSLPPSGRPAPPGGDVRDRESADHRIGHAERPRSEEHTSELQSLMRISYAVFCLKKKKHHKNHNHTHQTITTL